MLQKSTSHYNIIVCCFSPVRFSSYLVVLVSVLLDTLVDLALFGVNVHIRSCCSYFMFICCIWWLFSLWCVLLKFLNTIFRVTVP